MKPLVPCIGLAVLLTLGETGQVLRSEDERGPAPCHGTYKDTTLSEDDLVQVVNEHFDWINSGGERGRRANLCGAMLYGAHLAKEVLSKADLHDAFLVEAQLKQSWLTDADLRAAALQSADLTGAYLENADMSGADARNANFSNAKLGEAKLRQAVLIEAVFVGADLTKARLRDAILTDANLSGANLRDVDLTGVNFDLVSGGIPDPLSLTGSDTLHKVTYRHSPHSLIELREALHKAGLRAEERQVTYAIERGRTERGSVVEQAFKYVMFELTSDYGMAPLRPLKILIVLMCVFWVIYWVGLIVGRKGGIVAAWEGENSKYERVSSRFFFPNLHAMVVGKRGEVLLDMLILPLAAFYFSVLSAFHIGWRELNLGSWLMRLQPREYTLRPKGWMRTVSALQSIISVYLVALWALTYFGRPFE